MKTGVLLMMKLLLLPPRVVLWAQAEENNGDLTYTISWEGNSAEVSEFRSYMKHWVYIQSESKWKSPESPMPPEVLFEVEIEELTARAGRDYLPLARPIFQNVVLGDGLDPTGMHAQLWLPIPDNTTWEGTRQLRLTFKSLSPRVVIEGPAERLVTIYDNDTAAGAHPGIRGNVERIAATSANGWLVAGDFDFVDGVARPGLARLLPDQALDESFDPGTGANGPIFDIAESTEGGVWVVGAFSDVNGAPRNGVARLRSDGGVDEGFVPPAEFDGSEAVVVYDSLIPLENGGIVLAGLVQLAESGSRPIVVRLGPDGGVDPGFETAVLPVQQIDALGMLPDGRVLVAGTKESNERVLLRLGSNGEVDPGFELWLDGTATDIVTTPEGEIWVGTSQMLILLPADLEDVHGVRAAFVAGDAVHLGPVESLVRHQDGEVFFSGDGLMSRHEDGSTNSLFRVTGQFSELALSPNGVIAAVSSTLESWPVPRFTRFDLAGNRVGDLSIAGFARLPGGQTHITLRGQVGENAALQYSNDLKTWFYFNFPSRIWERTLIETNTAPVRFFRLLEP